MGLAAKSLAPRRRKDLPFLTPEYLQGIPVFTKHFFEQLCEYLIGEPRLRTSSGVRGSTIVFDNYQDVPGGSLFHDVIHHGLSCMPHGVNVFVLSRDEPPSIYSRLRAAGEMSLVGWEDIRLTADESDAIATLKAGKSVSSRILSFLRRASDGWVTGLLLLLESLRIGDLDFELSSGLSRQEIFGYFATEIFDRSSQDIRRFLLETSFLPKMNALMAGEFTEIQKASRIFHDLNRKNYFIYRYESHGHVFQYHPLFREFLLDKAKGTMAPELLAKIRSRAAEAMEEYGYVEDAVSLFLEAEKWPEAIRVIVGNAPKLICQGRWLTLQGWINALPESVTEHDPRLLYWMGLSMLPTHPGGSRDRFAKAFERFRNNGDAAGSYLALSGMLDSVTFRFDAFLELDDLIPLADELLEECHHQFPSSEIEARMAASMLNALILRQPDNAALDYWERRGLSLAGNITDIDTSLRILLPLAFLRVFSGELEKVPAILDVFNEQVAATDYAPLSVLLLRDMQAFLLLALRRL